MLPDVTPLERKLGFAFDDKGLLMQALIHRSYLHEHPNTAYSSNERLEFLGDAVLGFLVAEHVYSHYPEMSEGQLTSLRSAVVKGPALAVVARRLGLGDYLLLSKGEEASGGRTRSVLLSRAVEALIGAIFLDHGLEVTRRFLLAELTPILEDVVRGQLDRNNKSLLQEMIQGLLGITPAYRMVQTSGPDHEPHFTVEVCAGEQVLGRGSGRTKREAEQMAAAEALRNMEADRAEGSP